MRVLLQCENHAGYRAVSDREMGKDRVMKTILANVATFLAIVGPLLAGLVGGL
jgi:hypothetical protein